MLGFWLGSQNLARNLITILGGVQDQYVLTLNNGGILWKRANLF